MNSARFESDPGDEQADTICPNCGHDVSIHEMFNPPRCPVIRLQFKHALITTYSKARHGNE